MLLTPFIIEFGKTAGSMILVYGSHYTSSKIYNAVCVPDGFLGFIQGIFTTASPWCRATLGFMQSTETAYSSAILVGLSRIVMTGIGI
jgi:hypothetical protein